MTNKTPQSDPTRANAEAPALHLQPFAERALPRKSISAMRRDQQTPTVALAVPPPTDNATPAAELKRVDDLKALRAENIRRAKQAGQYGSKSLGSAALGQARRS